MRPRWGGARGAMALPPFGCGRRPSRRRSGYGARGSDRDAEIVGDRFVEPPHTTTSRTLSSRSVGPARGSPTVVRLVEQAATTHSLPLHVWRSHARTGSRWPRSPAFVVVRAPHRRPTGPAPRGKRGSAREGRFDRPPALCA